jgi:putative FmdB family regulatory protein
MALYEYRCERDGAFEIRFALGTAATSTACPVCSDGAPRVFSSPMLLTQPRELVAAIDHAEKTRESPDVVTSLPHAPPRRRTPMAPLTPALRRRPRP